MANKTFKNSIVWNKSYKLALDVYQLTQKLPIEEKYGLKSQIRRCAISIPSNISEGLFRNSKPELAQFMTIAKGSCGELMMQLMICRDLRYIDEDEFEKSQQKITEIIKILFSIIKTIKNY